MQGNFEFLNAEAKTVQPKQDEEGKHETTTPEPLTEPVPKKRKLTKEEKMELKRLKKIQKKEKALEDRKQLMRDHLSRELKYTDLSYKRGFTDWENMCMKIKLKELQVELMELWQSVNSNLDRKNYEITLLQEELVIADEQHQRNFSKHVEIMEYLITVSLQFVSHSFLGYHDPTIEFFEYSLNAMKVAYEKESYKIVKDFLIERNEVYGVVAEQKSFCENFLHSKNFAFQQKLNQMKERFEAGKTDIIDSNIEKRYILRDETSNKMTHLYNQLLNIVQSLQQEALDPKRQTRYNKYVEKQNAGSAEFAKMTEAANKGQETIFLLHKKLNHYETTMNHKIVELKNERMFYVEHYWQLKEAHKKEGQFADSQLSILANESYKTLTELKRQQKYGELLIGLAQCCRKLQTEKEKVLPWPQEDEIAEIIKAFDDTDKSIEHIRQMQLFWYRVCHAQTHVLCLKEEKRKLEEENAMYCERLKSCYEVETYDQIIKSLSIDPQPISTKSSSCPVCGGKPDEH